MATVVGDAVADNDKPGDKDGEAKQAAEATPAIDSEHPDKGKVEPGMRCCAAGGVKVVMAAACRQTRCLHVRVGKQSLESLDE